MKRKLKYIAIAVIALSILGIGIRYVARFELREPALEAYFFNLNRGRSIFLRTPHGETILIDGGQNGEVIRELSKVMPFYRRRIDTLVVTSAAAKNVGGLIEVLERYEAGRVVKPEIMGTSTALSAFERVVKRKKLEVKKVKKGDDLTIDSVLFDVLFPDPNFKFNKTSTPEMVLKVEYASTTLLFLGDVSITIQKSLIKELDSVHLVEYAHGATKSRVSADFLGKLNPEVIVSTQRPKTLRFQFK